MNFFKKNYKKLIIAALVAVIIFVIGRNIVSKRNTPANIFNPAKQSLVTPVTKDLKDEITLAGSVDAASKANLQFQTPGILQWIGVKEGDTVKKYQAVASLNKDDLRKRLQIDFNNYQSQFSQFQDTQDKYKTIKDNNNLTDEMKRILDRSQFSLDNSVVSYELDDLSIKYATLVSPINGVVTAVSQPNGGLNVTPANATFSIIDPNSIYFKSNIDQEDVPKIHLGQPAQVSIDSFPNDSYTTQIDYISFTPVEGQTSTVYEVRFGLPQSNNDLKFRLGMDGDAHILLSEVKDAFTVPSDAVQESTDGSKFVYIKSPDSAKLVKRTVKTGIETDTDAQILEGLTANDQVVVQK
ncbi:MAG TPA: efflux RND transporter periplasmic adaptor subunit [Patescibacteria group bacterium]